jgi:hypothetical protein
MWDKTTKLRQRCTITDPRDYRGADISGISAGYKINLQSNPDLAFMVTECGFLGLGLRSVGPGDVIALLYGAALPAILHPLPNGQFAFRGVALVNGVSFSELMEIAPDLELAVNDFQLC